MNICIVGAGAIGGWIAARLGLAGTDVAVIARGETLDAIDTKGCFSRTAGDTRCIAVNAVADPSTLGIHDLLIVAVKAPSPAANRFERSNLWSVRRPRSFRCSTACRGGSPMIRCGRWILK